MLVDKDAESAGDVRVIDESGEDYLFSADRFVAIEVPAAVKASNGTDEDRSPCRLISVTTPFVGRAMCDGPRS